MKGGLISLSAVYCVGLCRSNPHMMATGRLRSKESYGMTTADDSCLTKQVEEDHSVGHTGVIKTGNKLASSEAPLTSQSPPQHSVEEVNMVAAHSLARYYHFYFLSFNTLFNHLQNTL